MYHAACKVEFQPFNQSYSQLTFFDFFLKKKSFLCHAPRHVPGGNLVYQVYMYV